MTTIIIDWTLLYNFLNSNFFVAIITLFVGFAAYSIYIKQKQDTKRSAGEIILLEIEYAERQLLKIGELKKDNALVDNIYLMPNASWNTYNHLFVRDFDRNEWDKITTFYNKCRLYDEAVGHNGSAIAKDIDERRINIHRVLADYAKDQADDEQGATFNESQRATSSLSQANAFLRLFAEQQGPYVYTFSAQKYIDDATAVLSTIETTLSVTSVGTKLKKLRDHRSLPARFASAIRKRG